MADEPTIAEQLAEMREAIDALREAMDDHGWCTYEPPSGADVSQLDLFAFERRIIKRLDALEAQLTQPKRIRNAH